MQANAPNGVGFRTFTVDEYYRMAELGILREDERVELIDGHIRQMNAIGSRHAACVSRMNALFSASLADRALVSVQNPLRIGEMVEPEPDILLAKPRADFYAERHPVPDDTYLVVEVADTSLGYDRNEKLPLYARAGVAEVWIVDLGDELIEVHTHPSNGVFAQTRRVQRGGTLTIDAFPDFRASVEAVLG